jgi:hypothetical protein
MMHYYYAGLDPFSLSLTLIFNSLVRNQEHRICLCDRPSKHYIELSCAIVELDPLNLKFYTHYIFTTSFCLFHRTRECTVYFLVEMVGLVTQHVGLHPHHEDDQHGIKKPIHIAVSLHEFSLGYKRTLNTLFIF